MRELSTFSTWLLGGRGVDADYVVAWPSASISLAAPEIGVATVLQREVERGELSEARQQELYAAYRRLSEARWAAYEFRIDDVIDPERTREVVARALAMTEAKRAQNLGQRRRFDPA